MAASAGSIVAVGVSGKTYTADVYIPDATGTLLTFNAAGLAASTSPSELRFPENVVITDITTAAAPTAVGAAFKVNSGVLFGGTIRWADRINTLSTRHKMSIPVPAGAALSALQH
jgi:hypothetical protein